MLQRKFIRRQLYGQSPLLFGALRLFAGSLWVAVTLNFLLASWLIYASGGIVNSPAPWSRSLWRTASAQA